MNIWEVTEEQYEKILANTGRYTNPPGWWFELDGDVQGPYSTREAAETAAEALRLSPSSPTSK